MKWIKKLAKSNFWSVNTSYFALFTVADGVILLSAILLIIWLIVHYWFNSGIASYAIVIIDNKPPLRLNLDHAHQVHLIGRLGESILAIESGKIRFIASPCRGKQCIHAGWLTHGGDFSACLPNRISVTVHSTEENEQFDSIAY